MVSLVLVSLLLAPESGSPMSHIALTDLLAATGGRAIGVSDETTFGRVVTDSRNVRAGDLFWAIEGERFDGHTFAEAAVAAGATACVVAESHSQPIDVPRIVVPDTRRALGALARFHRQQCDALVVGITGSVGKTTTRELVHAVLSAEHIGTRSPANFNNDLGLPLSLLNLDASHDYAVVEIAASGPGEIAALSDVAQPDVGIVTRVAPAHLSGFGSIEAVATEKAELVRAVDASGFVVLNGDDERVAAMADLATCPVIRVGESMENDLRGHVTSVAANDLRLLVDGAEYRVPATGRHHLVPALAAIAVGREIGLSAESINEGLAQFTPVTGRCHCESIGDWTVVDDTYNASPASMRAACGALTDLADGDRTILVAGDMLDLGESADEHHAEFGRFVARSGIDHVLLYGTHAERVAQEARQAGMDAHRLAVCSDVDALHTVLDCTLVPGAIVLAKGSRAMRMERVVTWLREQAIHTELPTGRHPARAA